MKKIYAIKNKLNNKMYIGETNNIQKRINNHFNKLKNNSHYNYKLQEEYNLYGKENFDVIILDEVEDNLADSKEVYYISKYDSYLNGYNLSGGGEKSKDYVFYNNDERKRKISEAVKKDWLTNEKRKENIIKANQSDKRRKEISEQWSGENNSHSIVKVDDVIKIRERYDKGEKPLEILKDYPKLTISGLKKICYRATWKNI